MTHRPALPLTFTRRDLALLWRAFKRQSRRVSAVAETVRIVRKAA